MAVGQLSRLAPVFGGNGKNAALALDPLDDDSRGPIGHRVFERRQIALGNESGAGQQRLELRPVLGLSGDG